VQDAIYVYEKARGSEEADKLREAIYEMTRAPAPSEDREPTLDEIERLVSRYGSARGYGARRETRSALMRAIENLAARASPSGEGAAKGGES
jgi:hypothetical protein